MKPGRCRARRDAGCGIVLAFIRPRGQRRRRDRAGRHLGVLQSRAVAAAGAGCRAVLGTSIFKLLEGSSSNELERLHRAALGTHNELRAHVRSCNGRFVASAVMRRSDGRDGPRVVWSFVDASCNEPAPELALWGTEIGLWDWDVANDRLTWINDWCEHSQLAAFAGSGHERLWQSRIHPEDLRTYLDVLTAQLAGQAHAI